MAPILLTRQGPLEGRLDPGSEWGYPWLPRCRNCTTDAPIASPEDALTNRPTPANAAAPRAMTALLGLGALGLAVALVWLGVAAWRNTADTAESGLRARLFSR